jgi:hypothetical protein
MMDVGVLEGAGIKKPDDLVGKKMAMVPALAESPCFAAYPQLIGIDPKSVAIVDVDPKPVERILASGERDAATGVASPRLPVLLSPDRAANWTLYFSAGVPTYSADIVSSQAVANANEGLAAAVVDAVPEGVAFTLTNPKKSAGILFEVAPRATLSASARDFICIGLSLPRFAVARRAAMEHGRGYGNPKIYKAVTGLVTTDPGTARPAVESCHSNGYMRTIKLMAAKWPQVTADIGEFGKYL